MLSTASFAVFDRYKLAKGHAFAAGVVTEPDKDLYQGIFDSLRGSAERAIANSRDATEYRLWNTRFFRDGGVQGQRPVDLWVSVLNVESDALGKYPQIYMIASDVGLEMGFAVAIHEDDYYNADIKRRNRNIVPVLYQKLPGASSEEVRKLDEQLKADAIWQYGIKSRQGPVGSFKSLPELIAFLKSSESSAHGGGAVYRTITADQFDRPDFDLDIEFSRAVNRFSPLMRMLVPSRKEEIRLGDLEVVDTASVEIPTFNPTNVQDGRRRILQTIAVRQGQAKFREQLLDAYGCRCAITGTAISATLQAAHITPYRGPDTNSVQNGILLRADIHNLFDLGLIGIDPESYEISVADELRGSAFAKLQGRKLRLPERRGMWPSKDALKERARLFSGLLD